MKNASISRLRIYPIKSLDPMEVDEVRVGISSLASDRLFAMLDENGVYVNGKRTGQVNQLKTKYDLPNRKVFFSRRGEEKKESFLLEEGNPQLDEYLSDFFDIKIKLTESTRGEFQDYPVVSSVTIVSEASLKALQQDMKAYTLENLRLRFRTNIELGGVEAYWEEQLFQSPGLGVRFKVADVEMIGISPRARCNVPPKDPMTGELDYTFVKKMMESRANSLPEDSTLLQFGRKPYFLTVNVYLPETEVGKKIKLKDKIEIIDTVELSE